jgi:hypothetical protein
MDNICDHKSTSIDMKKYMFSIGVFYSDVTKGALNAVYD